MAARRAQTRRRLRSLPVDEPIQPTRFSQAERERNELVAAGRPDPEIPEFRVSDQRSPNRLEQALHKQLAPQIAAVEAASKAVAPRRSTRLANKSTTELGATEMKESAPLSDVFDADAGGEAIQRYFSPPKSSKPYMVPPSQPAKNPLTLQGRVPRAIDDSDRDLGGFDRELWGFETAPLDDLPADIRQLADSEAAEVLNSMGTPEQQAGTSAVGSLMAVDPSGTLPKAMIMMRQGESKWTSESLAPLKDALNRFGEGAYALITGKSAPAGTVWESVQKWMRNLSWPTFTSRAPRHSFASDGEMVATYGATPRAPRFKPIEMTLDEYVTKNGFQRNYMPMEFESERQSANSENGWQRFKKAMAASFDPQRQSANPESLSLNGEDLARVERAVQKQSTFFDPEEAKVKLLSSGARSAQTYGASDTVAAAGTGVGRVESKVPFYAPQESKVGLLPPGARSTQSYGATATPRLAAFQPQGGQPVMQGSSGGGAAPAPLPGHSNVAPPVEGPNPFARPTPGPLENAAMGLNAISQVGALAGAGGSGGSAAPVALSAAAKAGGMARAMSGLSAAFTGLMTTSAVVGLALMGYQIAQMFTSADEAREQARKAEEHANSIGVGNEFRRARDAQDGSVSMQRQINESGLTQRWINQIDYSGGERLDKEDYGKQMEVTASLQARDAGRLAFGLPSVQNYWSRMGNLSTEQKLDVLDASRKSVTEWQQKQAGILQVPQAYISRPNSSIPIFNLRKPDEYENLMAIVTPKILAHRDKISEFDRFRLGLPEHHLTHDRNPKIIMTGQADGRYTRYLTSLKDSARNRFLDTNDEFTTRSMYAPRIEQEPTPLYDEGEKERLRMLEYASNHPVVKPTVATGRYRPGEAPHSLDNDPRSSERVNMLASRSAAEGKQIASLAQPAVKIGEAVATNETFGVPVTQEALMQQRAANVLDHMTMEDIVDGNNVSGGAHQNVISQVQQAATFPQSGPRDPELVSAQVDKIEAVTQGLGVQKRKFAKSSKYTRELDSFASSYLANGAIVPKPGASYLLEGQSVREVLSKLDLKSVPVGWQRAIRDVGSHFPSFYSSDWRRLCASLSRLREMEGMVEHGQRPLVDYNRNIA